MLAQKPGGSAQLPPQDLSHLPGTSPPMLCRSSTSGPDFRFLTRERGVEREHQRPTSDGPSRCLLSALRSRLKVPMRQTLHVICCRFQFPEAKHLSLVRVLVCLCVRELPVRYTVICYALASPTSRLGNTIPRGGLRIIPRCNNITEAERRIWVGRFVDNVLFRAPNSGPKRCVSLARVAGVQPVSVSVLRFNIQIYVAALELAMQWTAQSAHEHE